MQSINDSEAQSVDIPAIKELEGIGWKLGDTLLYQPEYQLTAEQQKEYSYPDGKMRKSIKPDLVLQDLNGQILAIFENKLEQKDEKKALDKLRLLYGQILKPRFLYACSKERKLFYDTSWRGLDAGEFRRTNEFLTLEQMKVKNEQLKNISAVKKVSIDTTIAGGYDPDVGKERYYQLDCINTLIDKYRAGETKMLVHMATGLGKTRTVVAFVKALLSHGLAKKVLFVVDRVLLADQAMDDGFALISKEHSAARIKTTNFKQQKHASIHVVVIDTLEIIFQGIPSNYYDLIIVDECHRSISINRKLIFNHFLCPRIGLTATPRIAVAKEGKEIPQEDLEIRDTYRLFGCESGEATYSFGLERGIEEGFLAEYNVLEILTYLTQEAEEEGIPIEYVLDPDTRARIDLPKEMRLMLEQLERKYISDERCDRIAEEIRKNTEYGEKVLVFGVSQAHCHMLTNALNKVFKDDGSSNPRYAEPIISDNNELNGYLKNRFKKPYLAPYIAVSVDIMTTGVDIKCVRYLAFAALTKSVGKYIQMVGRGTRLDPKTGKNSFKILDFVGLCQRMEDNRKGTTKPNVKVVDTIDGTGGGGETSPKGPYYIIDNPDPATMIQRVYIHGDDVRVVDNVPIDKAREIFEREAANPINNEVRDIQEKVRQNTDYEPTDEDLKIIDEWLKAPEIYLEEGQLQKIYDYPNGTTWEFLLHALGFKKIPTPKERIEQGYEAFIKSTTDFNDDQLKVLAKMKDIFATNLSSKQEIDLKKIFANPIYEKIIGKKEKVSQLFAGKFDAVISELKRNLKLPRS
ncbi:MAG: DEAD/DEAH box helicase family protein [Nitrospirae bacterium]|nr:DEAD/DEAH box helicase family protein [Nitrospirota bacterium]